MVKSYGKAVKLSNGTINLVEIYRNKLMLKCNNDNIKYLIKEMSYDKIIRSCLRNMVVFMDDMDNGFIIADREARSD